MRDPAVVAASPPPLLEREGAVAVLAGALTDVARTGRGQVVVLAGEAGAGKTAVLHGFCADLPCGTDVHWSACAALATPEPLGPLLALAATLGGDVRDAVGPGAAPHDLATALLREAEGRTPTVLVVEDVHWADEATLDVLRLLAARVTAVPLLLVLSYRSDQLARTGPLRVLLGDLPSAGPARRLEVPPLSRDAVAVLAEPAGVDAAALFARTGGNAFFVTEALAAADRVLPDTVRDAVLARSARLSDPARSVLDAVAVVPGATEVWLLDALEPPPAGAVDECLYSGMLTAEGATVSFRHELARLAVEESLPPDRRVALHRRALSALDARRHAARLAHHAEGAGDAEAVLRYAGAARSKRQRAAHTVRRPSSTSGRCASPTDWAGRSGPACSSATPPSAT